MLSTQVSRNIGNEDFQLQMKYFLKRYSFSTHNPVNEITSKTALELYKQEAGPGFLNLKAVPNLCKGVHIYNKFCEFWGEEITEAECFRRKLEGTLLDGFWREGDD